MHQTEQLSIKITYNFEQKKSDKNKHILHASICSQIEIKQNYTLQGGILKCKMCKTRQDKNYHKR